MLHQNEEIKVLHFGAEKYVPFENPLVKRRLSITSVANDLMDSEHIEQKCHLKHLFLSILRRKLSYTTWKQTTYTIQNRSKWSQTDFTQTFEMFESNKHFWSNLMEYPKLQKNYSAKLAVHHWNVLLKIIILKRRGRLYYTSSIKHSKMEIVFFWSRLNTLTFQQASIPHWW